jgi:hypothetical protein
MQYRHRITSSVRPPCLILGGGSSWDDDDPAIKFGWLTVTGAIARGGEYPAVALPEMVEFAIKNGYVTAKDIVEAVAKAL